MKLEIKDNTEELKKRLQHMQQLGKVKVKVGDSVRACETVLAEL